MLCLTAALWIQQAQAATELEARDAIRAIAQQALLREDFSALERLTEEYRTKKRRTSSGLWKLTLLDSGIEAGMGQLYRNRDPDTALREIEARIAKWVQRFPASPSAPIALSQAYIARAWKYRGSGAAHEVKQESWAPFFRYIAKAREHLEQHKRVASIDPRWYETMITVARAENWRREAFDALLNEALSREPLFYETYFRALEYLLPKWHGGTQDIEAFAQESAHRTARQEGRGLYARIYWYASQAQYGNDLFSESKAVWPRMRAGFDDVVKRYPDAWNLNHYAKFACLAQDRQKARELLERKDIAVIPQAWHPSPLREYCIEWALPKVRPAGIADLERRWSETAVGAPRPATPPAPPASLPGREPAR